VAAPSPIAERRALRDRLVALCAHDTTSGQEDQGLPAVLDQLQRLGATVTTFAVGPGRSNVLATFGATPRILFSTHLDTVPPFLPPTVDGDLVRGRGTCDAKGQIVAQLAAIETMLAAGTTAVAWLGVVGEETDSSGARAAVNLRERLPGLLGVINGEPTTNRLATGHRGILDVELHCTGVAAHSGKPQLGRSAIWSLIDWLTRIRSRVHAVDPELGPEVFNIGRIEGGEAMNVVPTQARARLLARLLPDSSFLDDLRRLAPEHGELRVIHETKADRFDPIGDFPRIAVTFGSDAPRLRVLAQDGRVALIGPGSIDVAHTPAEFIDLHELEVGIATNLAIARSMLNGVD
jgi:acetylornithine deacetylase